MIEYNMANNPWITFVKERYQIERKKDPKITYSETLKRAAKIYKNIKGGDSEPTTPNKTEKNNGETAAVINKLPETNTEITPEPSEISSTGGALPSLEPAMLSDSSVKNCGKSKKNKRKVRKVRKTRKYRK